VERFIPHAAVLDRAVCAVPFGRDQLEVAQRVEVAGAGTRLPASRLSPDRLRRKVREALTKTAGAKRVAEGFAVAGGPRAAADAFEAPDRIKPAAARQS
jgi:UDP:flavonoid glycosyltransferase YjiC (YdhE family)